MSSNNTETSAVPQPSTSTAVIRDELDSEYGFDTESESGESVRLADRRKRKDELDDKHRPTKESRVDRSMLDDERRKHMYRQGLMAQMDAHTRHKHLINQYLLYYPGATKLLQRDTSRDRTDLDIIRKSHQFVWDGDATDTCLRGASVPLLNKQMSRQKRLAKRYYDKLFKEYCIADLIRYKENKIALRWRVEKEVIAGKGQFVCGNKRCDQSRTLTSWELNFGYVENNKKKNALVKLRLCPDCSVKLNFHHKRKRAEKKPKKEKYKGHELVGPEAETKAKHEAEQEPTEQPEQQTTIELPAKPDAWKQPAEVDEDKSRDEEFEEFLDDLLL